MEFRRLGSSGLMVPALSLGTATFGGATPFFQAFGSSDVTHATRLVDVCLEAGLTMFDSSDAYSRGVAEEILGEALKGRSHRVLQGTADSGTIFRLQAVAGSVAEADALCRGINAAGGDCQVKR